MHEHRRVLRDEGFSLVELMTVVLILGILVAVAVASYAVTAESSRRVTCVSNQRAVREAILQYEIDHNGNRPDSLDDVRDNVQWTNGYARCVSGTGPDFLYDNTTGEVTCPTPGHELQ